MSSTARRLARRLRYLPDRLLHPRRRERAERRLRVAREAAPLRILILCHGNICRSPYAAARLRARLDGSDGPVDRVESAGFIGPGRAPPPAARTVAGERGVDVSGHRSSLATPARARDADLVVVMTARQARRAREALSAPRDCVVVLGDLDPRDVERRDILDPVERPERVFREVFHRIDRCVGRLADVLAGDGRAAR